MEYTITMVILSKLLSMLLLVKLYSLISVLGRRATRLHGRRLHKTSRPFLVR